MNILLQENERIDDLQINNLKIIQNTEGFCFGIDSVILSEFASEIKDNSTVIDLGTGTGIIPILLTAKTKTKNILGIEIQKNVAEMANRSIILNNLEDRIKILNMDMRDLDNRYSCDAIITNPPYKKTNTGIKNENISQLISRQEVKCTLEDIAKISYKLLKNNGEIYMIHRPERLVDIVETFRKHKLEIKKMRLVFSNEMSQSKLILIKAIKNGKPFLKIEKPLYIYKNDGNYTEEILKIYNKKS